jgi:hypothetical protein
LDYFGPDAKRRIAYATIFGFLPALAWSWYSLGDACNQANEANKQAEKERKGGKNTKCVISVLAHVWTTGFGLYGVLMAVGQVARLQDETITQKRSGVLTPREALPILSEMFNTEVSHLGYWNDTTVGVQKRDNGEDLFTERAVFGAQIRGVNVHFSHRGSGEANETHSFRLGFGHGVAPRGLEARDEHVFFENGGFDYIIKREKPVVGPPIDLDSMFNWSWDQLDCHFGDRFHLANWKTNKLYVEIQDNYDRRPVMVGKFSPFPPNGDSALEAMGNFIRNIDPNYQCLRPFGYEPDF